MSEYQKLKARALAAQQERERQVQRDIEIKAEKLKHQRQEEEERRKRQEAASREARTADLKRANEAINKGKLEVGRNKLEYDPFAEMERRPTPPLAPGAGAKKPDRGRTLPSKTGPAGSRDKGDIPRPPHTIESSTSASGPRAQKAKGKETSPPALGRKEKAAKALAESAKRGGSGSIFSVRSNIAGLGKGTTPLARNGSSSSSSMIKSKSKLRGGPEVGTGELRQLCPDRGTRDDRTIDQIQKDIKARKALPASASSATTKAEGKKRSRSPEKTSTTSKSKSTSNGLGRMIPPTAQRRRQPSPTPSTSSSSDSDDSRARSRNTKRPRPDVGERVNVSAMIQDIFRRPNRAPVRPVYSDEESGSDMEAGLSDVEEEEKRAIRIARREDELAETEERERRARKEKLRLERERGGR